MKKNNETVTKLRTGDEVIVIAGKDIGKKGTVQKISKFNNCLLYTSPSPRDRQKSRMPSSA